MRGDRRGRRFQRLMEHLLVGDTLRPMMGVGQIAGHLHAAIDETLRVPVLVVGRHLDFRQRRSEPDAAKLHLATHRDQPDVVRTCQLPRKKENPPLPTILNGRDTVEIRDRHFLWHTSISSRTSSRSRVA